MKKRGRKMILPVMVASSNIYHSGCLHGKTMQNCQTDRTAWFFVILMDWKVREPFVVSFLPSFHDSIPL